MSDWDILNNDCLKQLKLMEDDSVDLIITSPPYALQRKDLYGGVSAEDYPIWFSEIANEVKRVLKPSGSFVVNIKENCSNGVRETYVMETVLKLSNILRFTDTFIWKKTNPFPTGGNKRLKDAFEYCYWFTKTDDYKFFPEDENVLVPSTSKTLSSDLKRNGKRPATVTNGSGLSMHNRYASEMVRPSNVLELPTDVSSHEHPATFPVGLPSFFISLLTEENDKVVDIFNGSGTTGVACIMLNRNYVGIEINEKYCDISKKRLLDACNGSTDKEIITSDGTKLYTKQDIFGFFS